MALARLKKMMGYAGGTDEIMRGIAGAPAALGDVARAVGQAMPVQLAAPAPNPWAATAADAYTRAGQSFAGGNAPGGIGSLARGVFATLPAGAAALESSIGRTVGPALSEFAGGLMGAPPPVAAAAPVAGGPVVPASGPLPAAATPAQIARWGVGGPDSGHVGVGPGNAAPMYTPPPAQPSSWQTDDPHQIREAHRLGPGEAPATEVSAGPGVDVMRAGRYGGGMGLPLQARIALATEPAPMKAARDLYIGYNTEHDAIVGRALKAANGNASDPAFQRIQQQADAQFAMHLHELFGGAQLNMLQWMQSMSSNPSAAGYGVGQ